MHCNSFVTCISRNENGLILILGISSFCLQHYLNPPRLTLYQISTHRLINLLLLSFYLFPTLPHTSKWFLMLCKPSSELRPEIFNGIEVWRLCWPLHDRYLMALEPCLGLFAGVFGVIILLEYDLFKGFTPMLQTLLKFILQNLNIKVCIHLSLNLTAVSNPIPSHTALYHQASFPKLQCSFHQPITKPLPTFFSKPTSFHLTRDD